MQLKKMKRNRKISAKNKNRYGCSNLFVIGGEAPQALAALPVPDRVFIGGSGGKLEDIVRTVAAVAKEETLIVLTSVTEKTTNNAPRLLYELGYRVVISRIETSRYHYPEQEKTTFNPITIIVAERKNG